jgi:hypothetical protein
MAIGGLWCIQAWARRHGRRTAVILGCVGFGAFVFSHLLGLLIGAWPSVLLVSAVMATAAWTQADSRTRRAAPVDKSGRDSAEREPVLSA